MAYRKYKGRRGTGVRRHYKRKYTKKFSRRRRYLWSSLKPVPLKRFSGITDRTITVTSNTATYGGFAYTFCMVDAINNLAGYDYYKIVGAKLTLRPNYNCFFNQEPNGEVAMPLITWAVDYDDGGAPASTVAGFNTLRATGNSKMASFNKPISIYCKPRMNITAVELATPTAGNTILNSKNAWVNTTVDDVVYRGVKYVVRVPAMDTHGEAAQPTVFAWTEDVTLYMLAKRKTT